MKTKPIPEACMSKDAPFIITAAEPCETKLHVTDCAGHRRRIAIGAIRGIYVCGGGSTISVEREESCFHKDIFTDHPATVLQTLYNRTAFAHQTKALKETTQ